MSAEFYLKTLGVPRLTTIAGSEVRIRVRKHLAVLIVLAVEGGKVRRDRLITMLWPTSRSDRARGSLATAISFLRGKLGGDAIEPGRDYVELTPGLVAVDLERLEKGEILGDDFTPLLEVDAFLNGFEIESLPEFEAWKDRHYARLLPSIENALLSLTENSRRSGDLSGLARHADRLLQLNDLSEWGVKARMEAYALSGDRITALRVYDDWVERLHEELLAAPARAVEELALRLRRKSLAHPTDLKTTLPVPTEYWRDRLFVGRTREYRQLYHVWEVTRAGPAKHVLITGDSGVGKTTLADRFATAIALEGGSIARVRCFDLERSIPYAMIAGVVESLLDRPGASGTSPEALTELARSIPEVRRHFTNLPSPPEVTLEASRIRFAQAALEYTRALCEEAPVLIVIDDFDQADEASLAVLHLLMRKVNDAPLMVLLTSRCGLPLQREEVVSIRSHADSLHLESMEIEPLAEEEGHLLFDALITESVSKPSLSERRALLKAAAGFPLALELLVRDWQIHGSRSTALAIGAMTKEVDADPEVRYQQLTESLFSDFKDWEQVVVQVAAVLDRRVGDLDLYKTAGVSQGIVLGTLSKMVARRALRDGPKGLEWVNPSVRAHAYLMIPRSLRKALHDGIADQLIRRQIDGHNISHLEIAWHCMRSGRTREASAFLVSGARDAVSNGVPHEAELALSSGLPGIHDDYRVDASLTLGETLLELNRPRDACAILGSVKRVGGDKALAAELLMLQARHFMHELTAEEFAFESDRILSIVATATPEVAVMATYVGNRLVPLQEATPFSEALLAKSYAVDTVGLTPASLIRLFTSQARLHFLKRDMNDCRQLLDEAFRVAQLHGIRSGEYLFLLNGLGIIRAADGHYEEALLLATQLHGEATRVGNESRAASACMNAAVVSMRLGRYEDAAMWGERATQYQVAHFDRVWLAKWAHGMAAAWLGDEPLALRLADELLEIAATATSSGVRQVAYASAADVLLTAGKADQAYVAGRLASTDWTTCVANLEVAGRLARWAALSLEKDQSRFDVGTKLRWLVTQRIDIMDRAETLSALWILGQMSESEIEDLEILLSTLPGVTSQQLERLGTLRGWTKRHGHFLGPASKGLLAVS